MEPANRRKVLRQRFAAALVERCDELLDGLVCDLFNLFVFDLAVSCEVIWFLHTGRGTQAPRTQESGKAKFLCSKAGADGNGRDRNEVCLAQPCPSGGQSASSI